MDISYAFEVHVNEISKNNVEPEAHACRQLLNSEPLTKGLIDQEKAS